MAATAASRSPVLSLSTLSEGLPIKIDGQTYEIRHPNMLSLGAILRFEALRPRILPLLEKEDLSEAEGEELSRLLATVTEMFLDAPPDVRGRLTDQQRVLVMQAFVQLRSTRTTPTAGATTRRRNGARRSRA